MDVNLVWKYVIGYVFLFFLFVGEGMLNGVDIYYGVDFFIGGIFIVSLVDLIGNLV